MHFKYKLTHQSYQVKSHINTNKFCIETEVKSLSINLDFANNMTPEITIANRKD